MPRGRPRKIQNEEVIKDEEIGIVEKEQVKGEIVNEKDDKLDVDENYFDLKGRLLLVRIGSDSAPASDKDISDIENQLNNLLSDVDCKIFVTHHRVDIEII